MVTAMSSSHKCFAAMVVMFLQVSDWFSPLAGQQLGKPWAAVCLACGLPFGFLHDPPHPCPSVQDLSRSASQTLGSPWLVACHSSIYCWAWCEGSWSWWCLILRWSWSWFWSGAVSSLGFEALNEIWTLMLCMQNAWQMYQVAFCKCMYSLLCTCLVCKHI